MTVLAGRLFFRYFIRWPLRLHVGLFPDDCGGGFRAGVNGLPGSGVTHLVSRAVLRVAVLGSRWSVPIFWVPGWVVVLGLISWPVLGLVGRVLRLALVVPWLIIAVIVLVGALSVLLVVVVLVVGRAVHFFRGLMTKEKKKHNTKSSLMD